MFYFQTMKNIAENTYQTNPPKNFSFLKDLFRLNDSTVKLLKMQIPNFGYDGFGEFLFYRTYSRIKEDGKNEDWADCVIRVITGIMNIRKNWYEKNNIEWNEIECQRFAKDMALSMFNMEWLPPGRGLWSMGTDYLNDIGGIPLYNCAFISLNDLPKDIHWTMDLLMNGVGVGFGINKTNLKLFMPTSEKIKIIIADDREGWCDSTRVLLESFCCENHPEIEFDYSKIRKSGLPIKRFGGISSGPEPLIKLHEKIRKFCMIANHDHSYSESMLKADIANCVGCCVVAGNVRRSAMIAVGSIDDEDFLNLKDYDHKKFAYRAEHGWMSNNTVRLEKDEDFEKLGEIAKRLVEKGEPGYMNLLNIKKYGRVGKDDQVKEDNAVGLNPCGEIPIASYGVCNLSETFPTRCDSIENWYDACKFATFYCSSITLLPTHRPETNALINSDRRIGVGLVDYTGWIHDNGVCKVTKWLREGYKIVKNENKKLAYEAGIPESVRITTIKPGGTVPKLAGKTSGISYPLFKYTLRRVRVQKNSPMENFLIMHNVHHENDFYSDNTTVFEFPIKQGPAKVASDVSLWEQAMNLVLVQREWSDNAVSNTLNFKPKWELIKSIIYKDTDQFFEELTSINNEIGFDDMFEKILAEDEETFLSYDGKFKLVTLCTDEESIIKLFKFNSKHEEGQIEAVLSSIAPLTKSVTMLPHTAKGVYKQMPEEEIDEKTYFDMKKAIKKFDWSKFKNSQAIGEKFCDGDKCSI